jgi:hypothetical protein
VLELNPKSLQDVLDAVEKATLRKSDTEEEQEFLKKHGLA